MLRIVWVLVACFLSGCAKPVPQLPSVRTDSDQYIPDLQWCHKSCYEDHSGWCGLCDQKYTGWRERPIQPELETEEVGIDPRLSNSPSSPQQAPTPQVTEGQDLLPDGEKQIPSVELCHESCNESYSSGCRLCDENYIGWRERPLQPEFEIVPLQWQEKK
jgi:hypothetical protein